MTNAPTKKIATMIPITAVKKYYSTADFSAAEASVGVGGVIY